MRKTYLALSAILACAAANATPLGYSTPGMSLNTGVNLYAMGGFVTGYFLDSAASHGSRLWVNSSGPGLTSKSTIGGPGAQPGAAFNFGNFLQGTNIVLRLDVSAKSGWGSNAKFTTSYSVYSGSGSNNIDSLVHAYVQSWNASSVGTTSLGPYASAVMVGFEDLLGGGDKDYDDFQVVLTGVRIAQAAGLAGDTFAVDEPMTLLTASTTLLFMVSAFRRRATQGASRRT